MQQRKEYTFSLAQIIQLHSLCANYRPGTVGEWELFVPLSRRIWLTSEERERIDLREVRDAQGQMTYQWVNTDALFARALSQKQILALVALVRLPPQAMTWRVADADFRDELLLALGESMPVYEEDE